VADYILSEAAFQAQVIDLAHTLGYRVSHFRAAMNAKGQWRTPVAADGKGFPDLVMVRADTKRWAPRVIFAELKTDKGRLSSEQAAWLDALKSAGQETYLWRPRNWDEIVQVLR
jgi:hypothetical protein